MNLKLNKKIFYILIASFSIITISNRLRSQELDVISPERPGFTNPPSTVPPKHLQIESGFYYEHDKIKDEDIKTENFLYPTTLIRYGLLNNIELRLQVDVAGNSVTSGMDKISESGLNPLIVGAKIYICKQKKLRPETGFLFSLTLPYIGKNDFTPQYPAPGFAFYFQNTLTKKWNIGYNLGMQWNGNDANPASYITVAPGYNFSDKFGGFAEVYSYFSKGHVPDIRCDAGINYIPVPSVQLDLSGGPGITGPTKNYFISAGVSIRLPK